MARLTAAILAAFLDLKIGRSLKEAIVNTTIGITKPNITFNNIELITPLWMVSLLLTEITSYKYVFDVKVRKLANLFQKNWNSGMIKGK
ncbi:hypothetical protein KQ941_08405 [Paenibacillus xylanexedens]|uniref:hypothetical protein n=1 Tax=Paenibacillus xylanexedens TaxID=528191 RepID=UPI001F20E1AE|nr:hypothetical protein [Paenibacillus xylanexedens]MCF7754455.1 hypothetical protein [Paenibacillus xylanexedens]